MYDWQKKDAGFGRLVFNIEIPRKQEIEKKYELCSTRDGISFKNRESGDKIYGFTNYALDRNMRLHIKNLDNIVWEVENEDQNILRIYTFEANNTQCVNALAVCAKNKTEYDIHKNFKKDFVFHTNADQETIFIYKKDGKKFWLLGRNKYAELELLKNCVFCIDEIIEKEEFKNKIDNYEFHAVYQFCVKKDEKIDVIDYESVTEYQKKHEKEDIKISAEDIFYIWDDFTKSIHKEWEKITKEIGEIKYHLEPETGNERNICFEIAKNREEEYENALRNSVFGIESENKDGIRCVPNEVSKEEVAGTNKIRYWFSDKDISHRKKIAKTGTLKIIEPSEQKRRTKTIDKIFSSDGIIRKIKSFCDKNFQEDENIERDPIHKGLTEEVAKVVYGKSNPKEVDNDELINEIIKSAINTPDICLIQGPAGTGKTTIINAIITRLREYNKNLKILICAEQHDAVHNIMDKIVNKDKINYVYSKRFGVLTTDDSDNKYKEELLKNCEKFIDENKDDTDDEDKAKQDKIENIVNYLGKQQYADIETELNKFDNISREILNILKDCINLLQKDTINFDDIIFATYLSMSVNENNRQELEQNSSDELKNWIKNVVFLQKLKSCCTDTKQEEYLKSFVEEFVFAIQSDSIYNQSIREYADVIGGTCAQAYKANQDTDVLYDYVIIDEAARANPLDIFIPIFRGKHVILVGDHKQLPHYLPSADFEKYSDDNENAVILKQSLFGLLFDNIKKAENLTKKRVFMLNKQYRMPDVLGTFISKEFYDDKLENGDIGKDRHENDTGIYDGKNLVFINVPWGIDNGELRKNKSYERESEAQEVERIVSELINNRKDNKPIDLGVISFYKPQVSNIKTKLENLIKGKNTSDIYTKRVDNMCGTVDSFQGKEFDVVILSCVRSQQPCKNLGFLDAEEGKNRINVALSRARKLLIVIGDIETLENVGQDSEDMKEYFKELKEYIKDNEDDKCLFINKDKE